MALHGPMDPEFRKAAGQTISLDDQVSRWMTPNVPNGWRTASHATTKGRTLSRDDGTKVQLGLEHQAKNWPSPTTRIYKGGGQALTRADGKSRIDMLDWAAEAWSERPFQLFAHEELLLPDRPTPSGMRSSETRRSLNPLFVEWLMGWPEELSGFERSETEFARWLLQMRGCLSALRSRPTAPQGRLL